MIKCKHCSEEKPESEMVVRAGKPSKVCVACKESGGGRASKKRKAAARASERSAADLELVIPAGGFGINAMITEEGYLQLTQNNADADPDNICLTRHEARTLFEKFGPWIVGEAA